jgi:hypothetical protein
MKAMTTRNNTTDAPGACLRPIAAIFIAPTVPAHQADAGGGANEPVAERH